MKRGACERTIWLFDDDDVNGSSQGGRIDLVVNMPEITDELAQVIHAGRKGAVNRSDQTPMTTMLRSSFTDRYGRLYVNQTPREQKMIVTSSSNSIRC